MWGIMLKDFYVNRKELQIYSGLIFMCSLFFFIPFSEELLEKLSVMYSLFQLIAIFCIFLCIGRIQTAFLSSDERNCYCQFIFSSPCGLRGQVLSKYYSCLFLSIFGSFWCIFLLGINGLVTNRIYSLEIYIMVLFYLQLFLRAIEFPFLFRFGTKYGNYYKTGIVFIILFIIIVYGLYGDISHIPSAYKLIAYIANLDTTALSSKLIFLFGLQPVISLFSFYVSYYISCFCYKKGFENFY